MSRGILFAIAACAIGAPAIADPVADFYQDKRVNLIVSFGTGGTYGLYGRLVADHITQHLPGNPKVIVQHMPGAGGIVATNHMYNIAPKDGTHVGMLFKDIALAQVVQPNSVRYDARKLNWIGSVNQYYAVVMTWAASGAESIEAARKQEVIMASSGQGHHGTVLSQAMNELLGTRFRSITGYDGAGAMHLAMERGEVHARIGSWESIKTGQAGWIRDKKIHLIAQAGVSKSAELRDVPLVLDLVKDPADRSMIELIDSGSVVGWSLSMPPDVPAERVAAWRAAFEKMVKDPDFLAAAKKVNADVDPKTGKEISEVIDRVLSSSPEVFERTRKIANSAK
ncbi:MAG: tripartite tricarboxylate transporter substrate-binding protein [Beijerinckiaceae bacterium]|nr:tripartite tricarboxylate transporter substrate-binding protein [Beijerinckiaceae bacterium]